MGACALCVCVCARMPLSVQLWRFIHISFLLLLLLHQQLLVHVIQGLSKGGLYKLGV